VGEFLDAAFACGEQVSKQSKKGPIRSLHYFLPVIDEVRNLPVSADYIQYLHSKLATFEKGRRSPYQAGL
jgi:hypothetical protein